MSLSEIRKELREMRKSVVKPVSKMKKADCVAELERMKMMHKKEEKMEKTEHREEEKAVKKVMKEKEVPKEKGLSTGLSKLKHILKLYGVVKNEGKQ